MARHPIIESVMADIEGLDFADDEKRQDAEDSIICTVQTLIDRLATSADALAAKDKALEEMRAELERAQTLAANVSGAENELLIEWPGKVALSISKDEVGYAVVINGAWMPGRCIVFDNPEEAAKEITSAITARAQAEGQTP